MNALVDFHFLRLYWLLALLPLFYILWLMIKKRLGSRSWEMVCDETLLPHILTGQTGRRRGLAVFLTGLGGLLSILALAGPVWEQLPQPVFTRESSLVIALDLSRSMDADDVSPSRLERARFKIADILNRRTDGQTALLVFAGDSFTVTPLTDDTATIESQLTALGTGIMPVQGNDTLRALSLAEELLKNAGAGEGDILFITDEIDYEAVKQKARELNNQGYRVSVLGMGTLQGVPIPLPDGSFLKDSRGKIVVPTLDEENMKSLADAGGGIYQRVDLGDADVDRLLAFMESHALEGNIEATELKTDTWLEQGPWLLLGLLPLMALLFRRGYIVVLVIFLAPFPGEVHALGWEDLWLRPDQQAKRAFDEGNTERAAELFDDPAWKGVAQYRQGNFEGAVESLQNQAEDLENVYNLGNALARLGRYQEAINAYNHVLEQIPEHEDALYNKELLEKELDKQQQRQDNPQQGQQDQEQEQDLSDEQQQDQQQQQSAGDSQESSQDQQQQSADSRQDQSETQDAQQADNQQQQTDPMQQQQAQDGQDEEEQPQQEQLAQSDVSPADEDQQATEQWLRRIPDDPAGLLRRKFRYQYQQRGNTASNPEKTW